MCCAIPAWNKGIFIGGGTTVDSTPSGRTWFSGFAWGEC